MGTSFPCLIWNRWIIGSSICVCIWIEGLCIYRINKSSSFFPIFYFNVSWSRWKAITSRIKKLKSEWNGIKWIAHLIIVANVLGNMFDVLLYRWAIECFWRMDIFLRSSVRIQYEVISYHICFSLLDLNYSLSINFFFFFWKNSTKIDLSFFSSCYNCWHRISISPYCWSLLWDVFLSNFFWLIKFSALRSLLYFASIIWYPFEPFSRIKLCLCSCCWRWNASHYIRRFNDKLWKRYAVYNDGNMEWTSFIVGIVFN